MNTIIKKRMKYFMLLLTLLFLIISSLTPTNYVGAEELVKPKSTVTVIATGGTIGSLGTSRVSYLNYGASRINIEDMVAYIQPEVNEYANV